MSKYVNDAFYTLGAIEAIVSTEPDSAFRNMPDSERVERIRGALDALAKRERAS